MVLLALRRASSSLDWLLIDELECLSRRVVYRQLITDDDNTAADAASGSLSSRKMQRLKEEHWTVQRDEEHDTIKIIDDDHDTSNSNSNSNNHQQASATAADEDNNIMHTTIQLINTLQTIRNLTTKTLPELSSRIIHAASPILHELSRGYFVPFLTVALACLGRIHVLVLQLGREMVGMLSQHVPTLRERVVGGSSISSSISSSSSMMRKGKSGSSGGGSGFMKQLEGAVSPLFVVSVPTPMKKGSGGESSNNEWNDLMKPFVEISHDEFTKKINNFVNERRWKDAMATFGIKKDDDLDEKIQLMSSQSDNVQGGNEEGSNDVNSMNMDDMGELVYVQQEQNDDDDDEKGTTRSSSSVGVDDNLKRVLDKRRIDETSSTLSAAKKKKKKKRRKKKKKSLNDAEVTQDDAAVSTRKIADDGSAKAESKESKQTADNTKMRAEESSAKALSNQNDTPNSADEPVHFALSSKEAVTGGDEVILDDDEEEEEEEEVEPSAKQKQKKSKKKKTKKKSKNVIDDIFG